MGVKVVTKHGEEVLFPTATKVEDIDGEQLVIKDAQGELLGGVNNWDYFMKYEPPKDLDSPNNGHALTCCCTVPHKENPPVQGGTDE